MRRRLRVRSRAPTGLEDYLERHVPASPEALLFCSGSGGYLARSNWNATFRRSADAIGLPAVRPHELRHTGATLAAATGATIKELMRRLGHSSPTAALLHQHAAEDRDVEIARAPDACWVQPVIGRRSGPGRRTRPRRGGSRVGHAEALGHVWVTSPRAEALTGCWPAQTRLQDPAFQAGLVKCPRRLKTLGCPRGSLHQSTSGRLLSSH